jgi:hypothetical protein
VGTQTVPKLLPSENGTVIRTRRGVQEARFWPRLPCWCRYRSTADHHPPHRPQTCTFFFFFFIPLDTGPRRPLSLEF